MFLNPVTSSLFHFVCVIPMRKTDNTLLRVDLEHLIKGPTHLDSFRSKGRIRITRGETRSFLALDLEFSWPPTHALQYDRGRKERT